MRIGLCGGDGRMGRLCAEVFTAAGETVAFSVDPRFSGRDGREYRAFSDLPDALSCDCVVDFSAPEAALPLLAFCTGRQIPCVIATTGQPPENAGAIRKAASVIPVFTARNFSLGVHLCGALVEALAAALPGADVEIVETHHASKADAPSGTALYFADRVRAGSGAENYVYDRRVSGGRKSGEIGIHSLRGGSVVGRHRIGFYLGGESMILTHIAEDRALFAHGALAAARFLAGKPPALYGMEDLVRSLHGA